MNLTQAQIDIIKPEWDKTLQWIEETEEKIKNDKCNKSYSDEHSWEPCDNGIKCIHCGYKKESEFAQKMKLLRECDNSHMQRFD